LNDASMTGIAPPLILVVSGDEGVRQQLVHDIDRRFGADTRLRRRARPMPRWSV
jgi:hypothetical protein